MFNSGFDTFLALLKNDVCYELSDVRTGGVLAARPLPIEQMVRAGKTVQYDPAEVVFKESASRLYAPDGKTIEHW
jgi:hypothetical protein